MIRRVALASAIALGACVARLLWVVVPMSGALQTLEPELAETCDAVPIHAGTEDVAIEPATRTVFVSATERRGPRGDDPADGIYAFPLDAPSRVARVSPPALRDFHPHGISLWRDGEETRLFSISHGASGGHTVEIFRVGAGGALRHLESVAFEAMSRPNDLVAVGPRQFYATNSRYFDAGPLVALEQFFALPLSSVAYFDGSEGRIVARGLAFANGINASHDGRTIYVAEVLRRHLRIFDRDPSSGALARRATLPLGTGPDNIDRNADGSLWIAGHTKVFEYLGHVRDPDATAPSVVVRVEPAAGRVDTVFAALAGEIDAASVGAAHANRLVVGAVLEGHVLVCPLPERWSAGS